MNEDKFQRARARLDQLAFDAAVTGDSDPLSEDSQLAATIKHAAAPSDQLRAKQQQLRESGMLTAEGIHAETEKDRKAALENAENVRAALMKKAEPLLKQASDLANPVTEFGDAEQATLKMFNDLPESRRREVKRDTLLGRNPELARALAAAPQWVTGMTKNDLNILKGQCIDPALAEKAESIALRAKQHRRAISAVDSIIAQINAAK